MFFLSLGIFLTLIRSVPTATAKELLLSFRGKYSRHRRLRRNGGGGLRSLRGPGRQSLGGAPGAGAGGPRNHGEHFGLRFEKNAAVESCKQGSWQDGVGTECASRGACRGSGGSGGRPPGPGRGFGGRERPLGPGGVWRVKSTGLGLGVLLRKG